MLDPARILARPWMGWLLADLGAFLSNATWIRLVLWTALGGAVYAFYGFTHSRQRP